MAEMKRVAGMNTEVAIITGRTNICRRNICVYATAALRNVSIVKSGTVCSSIVYGNFFREFVLVMKSNMMADIRHTPTPVHHRAVQMESLYFRRPLGVCRGSGSENTSIGRERPSRGNSDSVNDNETGARDVGGGGGCCGRVGGVVGLKMSAGGPESEEVVGEGDEERERRKGEA
jgi:hypothetical protein